MEPRSLLADLSGDSLLRSLQWLPSTLRTRFKIRSSTHRSCLLQSHGLRPLNCILPSNCNKHLVKFHTPRLSPGLLPRSRGSSFFGQRLILTLALLKLSLIFQADFATPRLCFYGLLNVLHCHCLSGSPLGEEAGPPPRPGPGTSEAHGQPSCTQHPSPCHPRVGKVPSELGGGQECGLHSFHPEPGLRLCTDSQEGSCREGVGEWV